MSTQALTHEQEIHDRVKREERARASAPPIPAGSIVSIEVPGSRETGGQSRTVPAIVVEYRSEDHTLQLTAFHLGGLFHMHAVSPDAVKVLLSAATLDVPKLQDALGEVFARLDALEAPRMASKPSKG